MRRVVFSSLLCLITCGCARNAVFEVDLTVPALPEGMQRFVVVDVETGDVAFEDDWRSGARTGTPIGAMPQTLHYSVVSENPETVVQMKVQLCVSANCSALEDAPDRVSTVGYRFERVFYVGQRTRWRTELPLDAPVPGATATPIEVGRCEIEGCIEGSGDTSFCRLTTGEHYCE